jgi:hypothetical protein
VPERASLPAGSPPSTAEVGELRRLLLRFALGLPDVAIGDSRLDAGAAGLFVRVMVDDEAGFVMREFATLRNRPRWSLSVVLPVGAVAELQRLGWGRPRSADRSLRTLLLELARPRGDADLAPLERALALAHRAAADTHGRKR